MSSPPATLGQFEIIREIARSNDIVYEAYDPLMNRRVAVKELAIASGMTDVQREDRIARFRREAQAAGTLNHPNIMTVYAFGEDGGRTFMALEFLDGKTLRKEMDETGAMPPERAVEIAAAVLDGLAHAHAKGVVHRDIKPDNVQITSSGAVKITDFGIARLTFQPNLTMDGQVFGTPSYMSPEQVVGKDIDARSDLFSVGAMLYEMLSGEKPFAGDSVVSITYAIMNKEVPAPAGVAFPLWRVVQRSLEKAPGGRYSDAAEMAAELRSAVSPEPVQGYAHDPYLAPAVPISPAYGQPPPVAGPFLTPYDPYGNPNAAPPPFFQPPAYNQAPYQPGAYPPQAFAPPPPAYGYAPPPPLYVPPPPRAPLLNPEQTAFLKQAVTIFLLVGTLLGLVLVLVQRLSEARQVYEFDRADQVVLERARAIPAHVPLADRIRRVEEERTRLQGAASQAVLRRELAGMYRTFGEDLLARNDPPTAEANYQRAVELDPNNAALLTEVGALYARMAERENDARQRADLWRTSGEYWERAAVHERNAERSRDLKRASERMVLQYAATASSTRDPLLRADAKKALADLDSELEAGSDLAGRVRDLLSSL